MSKIRTLIEIKLDNAKLDLTNQHYSNKDKLIGNIEAYQDLLALIPKPRTEEEILKDFKKRSYEIETHNEIIYLKKNKYYIAINKEDKTYKAFYQDFKPQLIDKTDYRKVVYYQPKDITIKEHKLINELFECWGWL